MFQKKCRHLKSGITYVCMYLNPKMTCSTTRLGNQGCLNMQPQGLYLQLHPPDLWKFKRAELGLWPNGRWPAADRFHIKLGPFFLFFFQVYWLFIEAMIYFWLLQLSSQQAEHKRDWTTSLVEPSYPTKHPPVFFVLVVRRTISRLKRLQCSKKFTNFTLCIYIFSLWFLADTKINENLEQSARSYLEMNQESDRVGCSF